MNVIHKMLRKDCYVPLYIVIISLPGTADLEILCYFKLFSSIAKSAHNFSSLSFISFIAKSRAYIFLQTIVVNAKISRHFQFFLVYITCCSSFFLFITEWSFFCGTSKKSYYGPFHVFLEKLMTSLFCARVWDIPCIVRWLEQMVITCDRTSNGNFKNPNVESQA